MKQPLLKFTASITFMAVCALLAYGQVSTTGSISGTVTDPAGAVVANATILVKNNATGVEQAVQTADNGTFNVPVLPSGIYTITISTTTGFKQAVVTEVKVDVGTPSTINVALEPGGANETVTLVGGGELLQTQSATVATTITGRQITDLPFTSRDALDLVLLLPGTSTPGSPRTSTVNGLPKGALNITIDGVNVQDNTLKSSFGGGFFTFVRPRIDAIDEVTVSTATPGAESNGDGAVQIKFVTRGGTNDFRGSLYWYHRNPSLNANYYFNNLAGLARDRVLLNQYGGRLGGPITIPGLFNGRDRAFFFVNYEEYRLPEQTSRQRTILNPLAQRGIFQYNTASGVRQVDLLALAASRGQTSTIDPIIGRALAGIRASTSQGSVRPNDPNRDLFSFTNTGGQVRRFAAVRFDFNLTSKHHLENIWNYQVFRNMVDFLNGADPAFPGFLAGTGGQNSNRFSNSTALRSTLTPKLINEARFGLQGGLTLFRAENSPAAFADFGGFIFGTAVGIGGFAAAAPGGFSINNPNGSRSNNRGNAPVKQFTDTLTYVRGQHTFNFGGAFSQYNSFDQTFNNLVPSLTFGVVSSDPASSLLFTAANFPGASGADITLASGLYAVLTGRVTAISANAYKDETTGGYTYLGPSVERFRQRDFGVFAQDAWRVRPNLTVNAGLRWEVQFPFTTLNNTASITPFAEIYGVSGQGNLFRPGTLTGKVTQFNELQPGQKPYDTDWNNFAPSFGIAWSPDWKSGILNSLFGNTGQSVIRAGYSAALVREGLSVVSSIIGATANPGGFVTATRSTALGNLAPGTLLRNLNSSSVAAPFPSAPTYPVTGAATNSANVFEPNLRIGYVQSWTFGVQREITKDMVVEARYVGTRGVKLWRQINLNEVNVIENGLFNEFRRAQANIQANIAAGRGNTFAFTGVPGTSPLPIAFAYFVGTGNPMIIGSGDPNNPANYTTARNPGASNFTSATFVNPLFANNASPVDFANALDADAVRRANALAAGLPPNFLVVNPDYLGGAFVVTNQGRSYYDGVTLELRRRLSAGLLVQGSYTFSKALSNMYASSAVVISQPNTLRDGNLDKTISPFNITHAFKANWIYELPVGTGRTFLSNAGGVLDRILGGWAIHGAARIQSGTPFNLGNVQLVNMTREELQREVKIRQDPSGIVFFLPDDIILNTRRAFNVTASGFALGSPQGRYIAPAGSGGCLPRFTGDCGNARVVLYGPRFVRFDMSVVKKVRITERANVEFRGEFLNAFNNINFRIGGAGSEVVSATNFSSSAFGQTTQAYRDISTTNDPGGRIVQFVLRLNF